MAESTVEGLGAPRETAATRSWPATMAHVTDEIPADVPRATPAPAAGDPSSAAVPGERRLAHPPSDRFRAAEAAAELATAADAPDPAASVPRGIAVATVIGIVGAATIVVLGGIVTLSAGLVVVAATTGWAIAQGLRAGARQHLVGRRRMALAVGFAVVAVALGQVGLWLYARTEGGVLPLLDYLGEVFGYLVPLQFVAAALVAWTSAR